MKIRRRLALVLAAASACGGAGTASTTPTSPVEPAPTLRVVGSIIVSTIPNAVIPGDYYYPLTYGRAVQLYASVRDSAGRAMPEMPVSWSSTSPALTVDRDGVAMVGYGPVNGYVTATAGGVSGSMPFGVPYVRGSVTIDISPKTATIAVGDTIPYAVTFIKPAAYVPDPPYYVSSDQYQVVGVRNDRLVGLARGTANITVGASYGLVALPTPTLVVTVR